VIELLAESNNFGDTREGGLAGPTGLVIILLLVAGTIFLIRNMNARLRRLPDRFDSQGAAEPPRSASPLKSEAVKSETPNGAEDAR
jgi:hypothetical protein